MRNIKAHNWLMALIIIIFWQSLLTKAFAQPALNPDTIKKAAYNYLNIINNVNQELNINLVCSHLRKKTYTDFNFKDVYTFYDLNGLPTAYVYTTLNNNGEVGYIAMSPLESFLPLLSSSTNSHPFKNFPQCLDKACEITPTICENELNYRPIYLGLFFFFFVFNPDSDSPIVVEAITKNLVPYQMLFSMQKNYDQVRLKANLVVKSRERILRTEVQPALRFKTMKTDNLPAYNWYRGCTTTTLTMILSYYGIYQGYEGLAAPPDFFQWTLPKNWQWWFIDIDEYWDCLDSPSDINIPKDLADELADKMGISKECGFFANFGATAEEQKNAVETVARNHGHFFKAIVHEATDISTYTKEIDAERPVKIGYDIMAHTSRCGGHAVAGWGYTQISDNEHILYFNNTWDNQEGATGSMNSFTYENAFKLGYIYNFISLIGGRIEDIKGSELQPNQWGTISINVIAPEDNSYYIKVFDDDGKSAPVWEWAVVSAPIVGIESNVAQTPKIDLNRAEKHTFKFFVKPENIRSVQLGILKIYVFYYQPGMIQLNPMIKNYKNTSERFYNFLTL